MGSKISYHERGHNSYLGTCIEDPKVVLKQIFPHHRIRRYGVISHPFENETGPEGRDALKTGLVIEHVKAPQGMAITGTLAGIDLARASIRPPDRAYLLDAFGDALYSHTMVADSWKNLGPSLRITPLEHLDRLVYLHRNPPPEPEPVDPDDFYALDPDCQPDIDELEDDEKGDAATLVHLLELAEVGFNLVQATPADLRRILEESTAAAKR